MSPHVSAPHCPMTGCPYTTADQCGMPGCPQRFKRTAYVTGHPNGSTDIPKTSAVSLRREPWEGVA